MSTEHDLRKENKKYRERAQEAEVEVERLREQLEQVGTPDARFEAFAKLTDENRQVLAEFAEAIAAGADPALSPQERGVAAQRAAEMSLSFTQGIAGENFEPFIRHRLGWDDETTADEPATDEIDDVTNGSDGADEPLEDDMDEQKIAELIEAKAREIAEGIVEQRITGLTVQQRIERTLSDLGYNPLAESGEPDPRTMALLTLAKTMQDGTDLDGPAAIRAAHEKHGTMLSSAYDDQGSSRDVSDQGSRRDTEPQVPSGDGQEAAASSNGSASVEAPTPTIPGSGQTPAGSRRASSLNEAHDIMQERLADLELVD